MEPKLCELGERRHPGLSVVLPTSQTRMKWTTRSGVSSWLFLSRQLICCLNKGFAPPCSAEQPPLIASSIHIPLGNFSDCWEIRVRRHRRSFRSHFQPELPRRITLGPSRLGLENICHIYWVTFLTNSQTLKNISKGKTLSDRTRTL